MKPFWAELFGSALAFLLVGVAAPYLLFAIALWDLSPTRWHWFARLIAAGWSLRVLAYAVRTFDPQRSTKA